MEHLSHLPPMPAHYADYELGYISHRKGEDLETLYQEGTARMTPLTTAYDSPPLSRQQRGAASLHEMDACYDSASPAGNGSMSALLPCIQFCLTDTCMRI